MGVWTCVAPWVVAGDVAHTRSTTSNLIAGALATLIAVAVAFTAHGPHRPPDRQLQRRAPRDPKPL
ncbi:SPW repeat protein [Streptomyces sp. NPDC006333]|uniref:SPW repeat protein n=1 Tax=Streptomyces sp. NPDC006333 TaxID=3156753 RepID=UPI0033AAE28A